MKNCTRTWRKWYAPVSLLLLFSLTSFMGFSQLVEKGLTAANGQYIGFYQYTPYDYNPSQQPKYPLIIFLHGIDQRGNGTTDLPLVLGLGIPKNINEGHTMRFFWNGKWETFLVLIPQLSKSYGGWQNWYTTEMIKYAKANLNVDPNRITLTGLSLGGGGTWSFAGGSATNASELNCIGVCCGTCQSASFNWSNITNANMPVWAFHAQDDTRVGAGCSSAAIKAINDQNPAVKPYYTLWPEGQHWIWGRVYDTEYSWQNPNLYEWFLGQNKSLPVNIRPVPNAGAPQTITNGLGTVTLNASASTDADGKVVRYIWAKIAGPNYGAITTPVSTNGITTVTGLNVAGNYDYQVKVVDDRADWTFDTVRITVVPGAGPNKAPIANAGYDIIINQPANTATLNGSASYDPEGKPMVYTWSKIDGPAGGNITNAAAASTPVTGLTLGVYRFKLVVKDAEGLTGTDTVKLTVNEPNKPGVPLAGPDIVINLPINYTVLDGTASHDPDGKLSKYEWSRLTGPPTFTIASPNAVTTPLTGLVQGTYTFMLKVWDNLWVPTTDTVKVTVNPPSSNQPPAANAGADITLNLPNNSTTLNGSGSTDPNGNNTIASYVWSRLTGPTQFTLANDKAASTALSNLVAGTYTFKLVVTDNGGLAGNDTVKVTVNAPPNQPPVARAGTDVTLTLPANSLTLDGHGSSDPDGNITAHAWSYISGPAQYHLAAPAAVTSVLDNLVQGTYQFKLTVTDNGGQTASDTIVITVLPAPVNQAPIARAGADITITLPTDATTLDGSASTDPDGSISSYSWTWISGPAQYNLANAGSATTALSNLVAGTYVMALTVTDNKGLTHSDQVSVQVNPEPATNQAPVANAGVDIAINLPTTATTLNGSASADPDGSITGWLWTKLTGPASFHLSANNIASPGLSNLELGTYTFELVVTDNNGAGDKDTVTVTVNPEPPGNNQNAVAIAGADVTLTLPTNSVTLDGSQSYDPDGNINGYQWSRITGPAQFTLANDKAAVTVLSNLVAGTYTFKLRVWDNVFVPTEDTIRIVVNPEPNKAPVANAGGDVSITLPTNSTSLNGSGSSDPNGNNTITAYQWTWVSGPAQYTLANATAASTALTNLVQGTYTFRLLITDNGGLTDADTIAVTVHPQPNRAPVANAGNDASITLPVNSTTLNGTASADPDGNNTITTWKWTKLTGPASYAFDNAQAAATAVNNLAQGTYTFELAITDNGGLTDKDTITITVHPQPNRAPVANAGADLTIPLPNNSTTLDGTGSTDPDGNHTIVTWKWTQLNGPAPYNLANPNAATTALTNLVEGTYTFELKITDNGGLTATDVVVITVSPIPNRAPVANAGADHNIALPNNSVPLDGTGSTDPDGNNTIIAYSWTRLNGPAQYTLDDPSAASTTLSNLVEGTYTFQLTVTDNKGLSDDDVIVITVSPHPNRPPVAHAGNDISLTLPNNNTQLDGSTSSDPDPNTSLTYRWSKISGPASFSIADATAATTDLTDLEAGQYTFVLTVTDNFNSTDKDTVAVTVVMPPNVLPVAIAGDDITVEPATKEVHLDGSRSYDTDGTIVSWSWVKTFGNGALTIVNSASAKPIIMGAQEGEYEFELTVTDNRGGIARDKMRLSVVKIVLPNEKPVADAGKDITVAVPATVAALDGQDSRDPDGSITSYVWKQLSGPAGAVIDGNTAVTKVKGLQPGDYRFELTVTDDRGATAADTVHISVVNNLRYEDLFSVYPSPTNGAGQISVRCITDTLGMATFTIMDHFGRPVEVHKRMKTLTYQEFRFMVSHLRNGNYYIEMMIDRKKRMVTKFIKR